MTEHGTTTSNVAGDSANVGFQAGVVHGGIHYTVAPDASPEEKFETGVHFLDGGVPSKAWQLIRDAVVAKHHTDRVFFHWLLALVSGRTRNELSDEDATMLRNRQDIIHLTGNDVWADGVKVINRLLDFAQKPEADFHVLLQEFEKLSDTHRAMISKHLEHFLDGPLKGQMWDWDLERAERDQLAGGRVDRVWKFFHPDPAGPQSRPTLPPMITVAIRIQAVAATAAVAVAAIHIGYLLAQAGRISALLAYLVCIPAGYFGARDAVEWRFRTVRRRAKDEEYRTPPRHRAGAPPGGFARKVDQRFDHYFAKYVPAGVDRDAWRAATAGFRRSMRDEIVLVYRESRISVERISWLIRHRVTVVKKGWQKGTLWSYRTKLLTPLPTKARAVLGLAALAAGGIWAVSDAVSARPLSAARSTALMLIGGWIAARAWLHILLERRRAAADEFESEQARKGDDEAFARWKERLADKPDDGEMAAWLDCDRKMLLNEALRHYRLTMSNVIAYAFIEARAGSAGRARVKGGPWRYMRYRLLVFVLTADGVRQLTVQLDFANGAFHDRHRVNYRYEAVAAVRVHQADNHGRTFELALVNGQEIEAQVAGPEMEEFEPDENPEDVSEVTLDSAGLHHTLHVLEGIAAEGKEWITHEKRRGEARTRKLADAMGGPAPSP